MPALLAAIWSGMVALFGAKVAAVVAAGGVFVALTAAFAGAIESALDFTVPSLPSWALVGVSMLPAQVPVYVGAYVAALAARRVYDVSVAAVGLRV